MARRSGRIIGKRQKNSLFGRNRYYIQVQFDQTMNRDGQYRNEYEVDASMYNNLIVGAYVSGDFEQVPQGPGFNNFASSHLTSGLIGGNY